MKTGAKRQQYSCGLDAALEVVGGKWTPLILWGLHNEPRRFGELRREVPGISEKMLIQHLKKMEADGSTGPAVRLGTEAHEAYRGVSERAGSNTTTRERLKSR